MYATITNCEQKVTVCMCYIKKLATVHMLQLIIIKGKLQYVCYNYQLHTVSYSTHIQLLSTNSHKITVCVCCN